MLSSLAHPYVIPNLYGFHSSKEDILKLLSEYSYNMCFEAEKNHT